MATRITALSIEADGKYIFCDGENCQARTSAPVALQSFLLPDPQTLATRGWLFVHADGWPNHYCPHCAPGYLKALTGSEPGPEAGK
jgi:hypothetical protein